MPPKKCKNGRGEQLNEDRNPHVGTTLTRKVLLFRNARHEHLEQNIPDRTGHYMSGTGILHPNSSSYGIIKF